MRYRKLGSTGADVSAIALGCMSYGDPVRGKHAWTLDEDASRPLIQAAVEAGVTFFDTANSYSTGSSEEILGRALRDFARREEVVIATKVNGIMRQGPNGRGLSRKFIMGEVDQSLARLGVDYIDLYQIHRWDPSTPIAETLSTLNDLVRSGKVRYIGASSMRAWQLSKALYTSQLNGWSSFVTMQNHYNLLYREEEREMLPLCADQGLGVIPWSPLARGRLTRQWGTVTARSETDDFGRQLYPDSDRDIVDAVAQLADQRGVAAAQIALAWLLHQPTITAPIVGVTKAAHLQDAVASIQLDLSAEELGILERAYTPHAVAKLTS